jgi:hypothetical protein
MSASSAWMVKIGACEIIDHRAVLAAHRGRAAAEPRYLTLPGMTPK